MLSTKKGNHTCVVTIGVLVVAFLPALRLAASTVRIYAVERTPGTVHVIDSATDKVVQVIEGLGQPAGVSFSPDGSRVYVSNGTENGLDVLDRKTGRMIKKIPVSGHSSNIAVTKDGGRILVCIEEKPGALDFVDATSLEKVKSIPMAGNCHNPYVTQDGKYVVAGSISGNFFMVVDLQTEEPVWEVKFEDGVRPMAFENNPDGSTRRIFVQLSNFYGFAAVDFATHKEVARIKLPDEKGGRPRSEKETLSEQHTPSHGIGVAPDGKTLWVNSKQACAVFVYSLPDLKLIGRAPTGLTPDWVTFTPDGKKVYITNETDNSVSVIDAKTLKELRVQVGNDPRQLGTLVLP